MYWCNPPAGPASGATGMTCEANKIHHIYRRHCVEQMPDSKASDSVGAQDVAAPSAGRSRGAPGTRSRGSSDSMCSGWSDSVLPCLSFSSVDVPCTQVNTHIVTLELNCGEIIC